MNCAYHPEREASTICIRCEKFVCEECLVMWGDKAYCEPCYDEAYPRQAKAGGVPVRQEVIEAPSPLRSRIMLTWLIIGIAGIVALVVF